MSEQPLPLAGFRVVDMTEVWAGPQAASYLAELGADVIRVESYPRASQNRPLVMPLPGAVQAVAGTGDEPRIWDRATSYHIPNHSKRAIALDAGKPDGHEVLMRLLETADVFMIGFSAGTSKRLKIDYDSVRARNAAIIMISMPGWGERGLYQGFATIGSGLDAFSGHHYLRSYPGHGPDSNTSSVLQSDAVGALLSSFGLLTALHYKERTGKGQFIDMSQAEAMTTQLPRQFFEWSMNQRVQEPVGNTDPNAAPHNCYPCLEEDTWVVIAARSDAQWQALAGVLGKPQWTLEPELATLAGRLRHRDRIDAGVAEWTRTLSNVEAFERLQAAGVPAGPVYKTIEVLGDRHLAAREFFRTMDYPLLPSYKRPKLPWRMSKTETRLKHHTNLMGEYNREVLLELGYSEAEIDALEAANIIGDEYRPGGDVD